MKRRLALAAVLLLFLSPLLPAPVLACPDEDEPCGPCAPRPRPEMWAVGLAHWYGFPYIGQTMANGEVYTGQDLTIAVRVDLLPIFPLNSVVKLSSYCGTVTATVTDAMPIPASPAHANVIIDVSPTVAASLFCQGYGWNDAGVPYGEELVLIEIAKIMRPEIPAKSYPAAPKSGLQSPTIPPSRNPE